MLVHVLSNQLEDGNLKYLYLVVFTYDEQCLRERNVTLEGGLSDTLNM